MKLVKTITTIILLTLISYSTLQAQTHPGIGFFSNAFSKVKPFKGISIKVRNESIIQLNWPKIDNASSYTMQLQKIVKGQNITVGESTGKRNSVEFINIKLDKNRRYQWVLTGKTTSGETFYTSGGFVTNIMKSF